MKGNKMNIKRRFGRFVTQLKAQYFLNEKEGKWNECTVININPKGMGVEFHEYIDVGSTIHLVIIIPGELETIVVKGILKWIKQGKNDFIAGIELTEMLDDIKFAKLSDTEYLEPFSHGKYLFILLSLFKMIILKSSKYFKS